MKPICTDDSKKEFYDRDLKCNLCHRLICRYNLLNPEESETTGICKECYAGLIYRNE